MFSWVAVKMVGYGSFRNTGRGSLCLKGNTMPSHYHCQFATACLCQNKDKDYRIVAIMVPPVLRSTSLSAHGALSLHSLQSVKKMLETRSPRLTFFKRSRTKET